MSSPRYTRSPNRSKAKDNLRPPPLGTGDCNTKYALNVYSVHNLSTRCRCPVDKSSKSFHSQSHLSTEIVDKSCKLWIKIVVNKGLRQFVAFDRSFACG